MPMSFTMGTGGPPAGTYLAEFSRIEEFTEHLDKFGRAVRLVWKVLAGDHAGEEASCICSARLSVKSNLGKFAVALTGGPVSAGTEVDFETFIGARGTIVVEETDNGGTKVTTFLKTA